MRELIPTRRGFPIGRPSSYSFSIRFRSGSRELTDYLHIDLDDLIYEMELAASRRVDKLIDEHERGRRR